VFTLQSSATSVQQVSEGPKSLSLSRCLTPSHYLTLTHSLSHLERHSLIVADGGGEDGIVGVEEGVHAYDVLAAVAVVRIVVVDAHCVVTVAD
jgi:hypothetical protein